MLTLKKQNFDLKQQNSDKIDFFWQNKIALLINDSYEPNIKHKRNQSKH